MEEGRSFERVASYVPCTGTGSLLWFVGDPETLQYGISSGCTKWISDEGGVFAKGCILAKEDPRDPSTPELPGFECFFAKERSDRMRHVQEKLSAMVTSREKKIVVIGAYAQVTNFSLQDEWTTAPFGYPPLWAQTTSKEFSELKITNGKEIFKRSKTTEFSVSFVGELLEQDLWGATLISSEYQQYTIVHQPSTNQIELTVSVTHGKELRDKFAWKTGGDELVKVEHFDKGAQGYIRAFIPQGVIVPLGLTALNPLIAYWNWLQTTIN